MARHIQDFRLQENPDQSFAAIHQYMLSSGYEYRNYEGEMVFKKGKGWFMAPTFVKVTYGPDRVRLEAWIKYAILPGVYAGELGREGFVGCAAKGPLKKAFDWIAWRLGNPATALCRGMDTEPSRMPPIHLPLPSQSSQFQN